VVGNHEYRFQQFLEGQPIRLEFGLADTVGELDAQPAEVRDEVLSFLRTLPSHVVLDHGDLVVAHTGLPEAVHGLDSDDVRHLAAWGVLTGDVDPGDPAKRHQWVHSYRGRAAVVYGHTAVSAPVWQHNTIDIDTGCVFGGRLTAPLARA
jgi:diadenosine tetraphosphatase ApaH/serine/threonine PP2A family protein phosphatase